MTQQNDRSTPRPTRHTLFWRLSAIFVVPLLIVVLGTGFVLLQFNPNRYAPALIAALEQMTGRHVTLNGPVTIRWSLNPSIEASQIEIANPPGFPDKDVLTLHGLRAEINLLPLLSNRVDILKLALIEPHLILERLPDGTADWDFSAVSSHPPKGPLPFLHNNIRMALKAVQVEDGLVTIRTSAGRSVDIHVTKLTGTAASLSSPLHVTARAEIGSAPFTIAGTLGPIERFSGIGSGPWPIDLTATMAGARIRMDGTIKRPRNASGYNLAVSLDIPALNRLGQTLPRALTGGLTLPALQHITAVAHIRDTQAMVPAISDLTITAGNSDLSALRPGLTLDTLAIDIPAENQPVTLRAAGASDSGAFNLQAHFGALQKLLPLVPTEAGAMPPGNFPISVAVQIGNATASVTGAIATPQNLSGAALALTAKIPNLSALSAIAGFRLPAWKNISLQTNLIDPGGIGLRNAIGLDDLTVTMDDAAFGGAATLYMAHQPKLQLSLDITRANLDAILASYARSAVTAQAFAATPPQLAEANALFIPNTSLPLGFLSWGDADIQLTADNLVWRGTSYTALQANATLKDKKLTIDPFTGEVPGGEITARANLDAASTPATESLAIKAPALALGPLLKALNQPGTAEGNMQIQLVAKSSGNTLWAIAANLHGQLGLASVNDRVDTNFLQRVFGPVATAANLPPPVGPNVIIRCFGLSIDANQGVAKLRALGLDSSPWLIQGTGSFNLGRESYDLNFQTFNGDHVQLGGSFVQPQLTALPQPTPLAPTPLPQRPDICPATLALARLGQAGPAPPPPSMVPPALAPGGNAPKSLLNSLLTP